jgi:hypothetical protein
MKNLLITILILLSGCHDQPRSRKIANHAMQQSIEVQPGEPMLQAGPHFSVVMRDGSPP